MLHSKKIQALVGAVILMLPLMGMQAGDEAPAKGHHGAARGEHLAKWDARIQKHIEKLTARIAAHPSAPDNIQSDEHQLVNDLGTKKTAVEKLLGDVQAHNKEAAKTDHAALKADCEVTKADRKQLKIDVQAYRATKPHAGQHKGKKEAGNQ